jgi:hypothetical protein
MNNKLPINVISVLLTALVVGCSSLPEEAIKYTNYEEAEVSVCFGGYWYFQYSELIFIAEQDINGFMIECEERVRI